jgi:putative transcriptional regulator
MTKDDEVKRVWHLKGEKAKEPYAYTGCGLDGIYLISGYEVKETPHGRTVTIRNLDGLHRAIGRYLVEYKKLLTGKEIRFLRTEMDISQSELARLIGCDAQQIARYEKEENKISGPADRLLRMIYRNVALSDASIHVRDILKELDEMDARSMKKVVFEETAIGWKAAA